MHRCHRRLSIALLLAVASLSVLAPAARAGDEMLEFTLGVDFFFLDKPCPASDLPTLQTVTPVPKIVDPFLEDDIVFFCDIQVSRKERPAKNVKGSFAADLIRQDNVSGVGTVVDSERGRFKTDSEGNATFDFDFPAELFADGFESGDVSAWSYTQTDFTNRKKVDNVAVQCVKGAGGTSSE